ncbi:unnamed protein product [Dibothriocephalus latus]|uniref:Reverse transcriptase domain-containing protein n=1 Tax=Dibothriocephalus latus TaxID=60516 RepID=A0A3P7N6I2_DIBLA|nr:unnamed protein product [Dibothriocephalus latus]
MEYIRPPTLCDSVRDVNGGFIANKSAKVDRWREHFEHLLNFGDHPSTPSLSSTVEFQPSPAYAVSCDLPSEDEVADAMQKLCNNKAPGGDGSFSVYVTPGHGPTKPDFALGRGCADKIVTLRRILEFRHSYQQLTAICFVAFAAAFDSIHRESLWRMMELYGVPTKLTAMIKAYHMSSGPQKSLSIVRYPVWCPTGLRPAPFCLTTSLTGFSGRSYMKRMVLSLRPGAG